MGGARAARRLLEGGPMLSWGAARGIESVSDNDDDSGKGKSGCRAPSYGRGNRLPTMPQPGRSSSDSRYQSRSRTSCQCDHCPAQGARNLYPPSSSRHQKGACTPPPIMEKKKRQCEHLSETHTGGHSSVHPSVPTDPSVSWMGAPELHHTHSTRPTNPLRGHTR